MFVLNDFFEIINLEIVSNSLGKFDPLNKVYLIEWTLID